MSSSIGRGFAVVLQHGYPENGLRKEQIPIGNGSCSGFILNFEGVVQVDTTLLFMYLASICFKSYSSTTSLNPTFPKPHYQGLQILKWACDFQVVLVFCCCLNHRENGGTLGMVPLVINPMYTLYSGNLLVISPFKGLVGGLNS